MALADRRRGKAQSFKKGNEGNTYKEIKNTNNMTVMSIKKLTAY